MKKAVLEALMEREGFNRQGENVWIGIGGGFSAVAVPL